MRFNLYQAAGLAALVALDHDHQIGVQGLGLKHDRIDHRHNLYTPADFLSQVTREGYVTFPEVVSPSEGRNSFTSQVS